MSDADYEQDYGYQGNPDVVTCWIGNRRIKEVERRGWYRLGPTMPGAVLMTGDPNDLGPDSVFGCSPPFPDGAANFAAWPDDLPAQCESAIERRLIAGLLALHAGRKAQVRFARGDSVVSEFKHMLDAREYPGMWLHVFPQVEVMDYRLDFLVIATGQNPDAAAWPVNSYCKIAVECDGSAFHTDKFKDLERDRQVWRRGIHTLRYTGSEIFHDAERCAELICKFAVERVWPDRMSRLTCCSQWETGWRDLISHAKQKWAVAYSEERDFPHQSGRAVGDES